MVFGQMSEAPCLCVSVGFNPTFPVVPKFKPSNKIIVSRMSGFEGTIRPVSV